MKADKNNRSKRKYIVPPGLISRFYSFVAHYKTADGEPVMIVGDTGVGKTMFLMLYEMLYQSEQKGKSCPIVKANCAHFGGKASDPNIARTELFGLKASSVHGSSERYKRTAKNPTGPIIDNGTSPDPNHPTDRIKKEKIDSHDVLGLVEKANDGLLILEEIGELPLEVQSMLLTFVETGEYRRVGDSEQKTSSVRIVGATNRESELRKDFRYRFFPFYIPPLHERRIDVLYYLAFKFPWLIKSLSPCETLAILAYHWPGGVREVERVGRLLQRRRELIKPTVNAAYMNRSFDDAIKEVVTDFEFDDPERLFMIDKQDTGLDIGKVASLYKRMHRSSINVNALERLLNHFNVGLNPGSKKRPFKGFKKAATEFPAVIQELYEPFHEALRGYSLFCSLFFQDPFRNGNNFDVATPTSSEFFYDLKNLPEEMIASCQKTVNEVFELLSAVKLSQDKSVPEQYDARETFIKDMVQQYPDNEFLSTLADCISFKTPKESSDTPDIFSMKYNEFLQYYINGLTNRWGSIPQAAKVLGIPEQTLYSKRRIIKSKLSS